MIKLFLLNTEQIFAQIWIWPREFFFSLSFVFCYWPPKASVLTVLARQVSCVRRVSVCLCVWSESDWSKNSPGTPVQFISFFPFLFVQKFESQKPWDESIFIFSLPQFEPPMVNLHLFAWLLRSRIDVHQMLCLNLLSTATVSFYLPLWLPLFGLWSS